ncbi:hypothetical protein EV426DRAFT_718334 [Tirmania nivea]|nr:hypothetical protein EV426DRAFT_718334 [Tirmania nivea]
MTSESAIPAATLAIASAVEAQNMAIALLQCPRYRPPLPPPLPAPAIGFDQFTDTDGTEEFVVVDLVEVDIEEFAFIVEANRTSVAQAMKQFLLAMKDAHDNNGVMFMALL